MKHDVVEDFADPDAHCTRCGKRGELTDLIVEDCPGEK